MTTTRDDSPRALIRYALAGTVVTVALAWGLYLARAVLLLVYISALIAIGLGPLVNAIERHRVSRRVQLPRWVAILAIYLVLLGLLVAIGVAIFPPLAEQSRGLWNAFPGLLRKAQQWLIARGLLAREITVREAVQATPVGGTDAVTSVVGAVTGFIGGIFGFVTILILAFYMQLYADGFVRTFVRLFPRGERARVAAACRSVSRKVSAWLSGQLLLASSIGITAAAGLYLMGVPYFYVLALIAAFGELIPIVGPVLAAVPAAIVALTVSPALALGVIVFFLVQQQFENHILVPKIMERQVGVSPVTVIVSLLIGGSLLGIVGAILAIPTAAIAQVIFHEIWPDVSEV